MDDMSDCMTWQFDMIQYQISTNILIQSMHMSRRTNKTMNPRAQRLLRSDTCRGGLLVGEEASQQDHLTDANH